jgi:hypothetical protein
MKDSSILNVLGFITSAFLLSACSTPNIETVAPVEIRTIQIKKPAPIVPAVDQLNLRKINWIIITPDNVDEKFAQIQKGELVLFALTTEGYENIALNLSDVRALIEQQNKIIAIYKAQF